MKVGINQFYRGDFRGKGLRVRRAIIQGNERIALVQGTRLLSGRRTALKLDAIPSRQFD
jgi:hypothetical protein